MQLLRVEGAVAVARLLRALADEVEAGAADVDGHHVELAVPLHAVVEAPNDAREQATVIDVRLMHPSARAWDIKRLRLAMTRPGD